MIYFYTVVIFICVLSMIALAVDVGKNTILNAPEINWFRATFSSVALGTVCEALGIFFDFYGCKPRWIHAVITCIEYSITPFLPVLLARSCGVKKTLHPMIIIMGFHALLEAVLLPFGLIIDINKKGGFARGPLQWIYFAFCAFSFVYILVVFVILAKKSKVKSFFTLIMSAVILTVGQLAVNFNDQICTGYISACFTTLLLYSYTQNFLRSQMLETIDLEQTIANHDSLTGVASRISYERKLDELNAEIKKHGSELKLAVCECDLNNLKIINDSFGHEAGDKYIRNCCRCICNFFKHSPVFRIGGDEFLIILQNEDFENLEGLKNAVREFSTNEAYRQCEIFEKKFFASGFAVFNPAVDTSIQQIVNRADFEMYDNKKALKKLILK